MTRTELPERLETECLVLRVRTVADAEDIFDYASLPEVAYPAGVLLTSITVTKMMFLSSAIPCTPTIGVEAMYQKQREP